MASFTSPRGMADILPADWPYWNFILGNAVEVATLFGYRRIETPNLGETSLFTRATGEVTDIVEKEMYSFRDRGGDELSLRPEGTAPVMRAYLEHGMDRLPQPVKLFYIERMYRYDRPQRGRYREHRQFGCEAIGSADAYVDVEMIALLDTFYRRIGLNDLSLQVNSIGDGTCRLAYLARLVEYLRERAESLAPLDRDRIERNPLRVLDSKEARSQAVIDGAPRMLDYLCEECAGHWRRVLHGLDLVGINYAVNFRLVRGLDYYTRTVFEFLPQVEGAQSVVGAGGRYDALAEAMGARHIPGIGFGSGIERLALNVRERGIEVPSVGGPDVYFVHHGAAAEDVALRETMRLRRAGIPADLMFGSRSLKAQMKRADASRAPFAAIVGDDEVRASEVTVKFLQSGEQSTMPVSRLEELLLQDAE